MNWTSYSDQVESISHRKGGKRVVWTRGGECLKAPNALEGRVDTCHEFCNIPVTFADVLSNIIVKGLPQKIYRLPSKFKRKGLVDNETHGRVRLQNYNGACDCPSWYWRNNGRESLRTLLYHRFRTGYKIVNVHTALEDYSANSGYLDPLYYKGRLGSEWDNYFLPVKNNRIGNQVITCSDINDNITFQDLVDFILLGKKSTTLTLHPY